MTTAHRIPKQSIDTQGITTKAMKHSKSPTSSAHRNSLSSFKFLMSNYLPPTLCFSRSDDSFRSNGGWFYRTKTAHKLSAFLQYSLCASLARFDPILPEGQRRRAVLWLIDIHSASLLSVYLYGYYIKYPAFCPCTELTKLRFDIVRNNGANWGVHSGRLCR